MAPEPQQPATGGLTAIFHTPGTTPGPEPTSNVLAAPAGPAPFVPAYQTNPITVVGYGFKWSVNQQYCLTFASAFLLTALLSDLKAEVVPEFPLGGTQLNGGFAEEQMVPWIRFGNGVQENAGVLAEPFSHGYSQEFAMQLCRRMIAAEGGAAE